MNFDATVKCIFFKVKSLDTKLWSPKDRWNSMIWSMRDSPEPYNPKQLKRKQSIYKPGKRRPKSFKTCRRKYATLDIFPNDSCSSDTEMMHGVDVTSFKALAVGFARILSASDSLV
uniref:Uncharacterized protein n=1 Tax=Spongospora subterranea TaxID=70186 RepID=A0A0H5R0W0_9EUKA|eukprot:CRZ07611.1 hypothetical protein [Spongospora subterranea]